MSTGPVSCLKKHSAAPAQQANCISSGEKRHDSRLMIRVNDADVVKYWKGILPFALALPSHGLFQSYSFPASYTQNLAGLSRRPSGRKDYPGMKIVNIRMPDKAASLPEKHQLPRGITDAATNSSDHAE
jgi:hypothetical protein